MGTIQEGSWRRGNDGKYKPFVRGIEKLDGTVIEVISRDGNSTFIEIIGVNEKIKGGYLYEFKHTHRPKVNKELIDGIYAIDVTKVNINLTGNDVSMEELEKALGL